MSLWLGLGGSVGATTYGTLLMMLSYFVIRITNLQNFVSEMRNKERTAVDSAQES